jgi:hypothetical protein
MRRLRPSLVISTWRTFGGKVMDFGKRTAWLRLVVNTVERVTLLLHFLTPGISRWDIRNRPAVVNADLRAASGKAGQLDRAALQRMAPFNLAESRVAFKAHETTGTGTGPMHV